MKRVSAPIEKFGAPISPCQARTYFHSMRENTVTGMISGRHMGMYRALSTEITNDVTSEQQKSIMTGVVSIMNLCGQSGIIIPRFCRARDIMLQKKHNNFSISAMRIIKIFEADMNYLLKHFGRQAMREIEKLEDGLSDMQHGFRKGRNTYHSAMSIITAIDIFRQARTGFALVETCLLYTSPSPRD